MSCTLAPSRFLLPQSFRGKRNSKYITGNSVDGRLPQLQQKYLAGKKNERYNKKESSSGSSSDPRCGARDYTNMSRSDPLMSAFTQLDLVKTATFFWHTYVLSSFLITRSFYPDQRFPLALTFYCVRLACCDSNIAASFKCTIIYVARCTQCS